MITLASDEDAEIDYEGVIKEKEKELKNIEERLAQARQMKSKLENIWDSRTYFF
jgi:hypothetical protein